MKKCHWCRREFDDVDTVEALLHFHKGGILIPDHMEVYCYDCFLFLSKEEVKEMPPRSFYDGR